VAIAGSASGDAKMDPIVTGIFRAGGRMRTDPSD